MTSETLFVSNWNWNLYYYFLNFISNCGPLISWIEWFGFEQCLNFH